MKLRLILGDQLSPTISSLMGVDKDHDTILICEVRSEATYVKHHKKKIVFVFAAMRHFANNLTQQGFNVRYIKYDDPQNSGSLFGEVKRELAASGCGEVLITEPSEYRLKAEMSGWAQDLETTVTICDDDRFLCKHIEFQDWAEGRKQLRMEYFYREMRRKYSVLMDGEKPVGGQWNFDSENRKPPKDGLTVPSTYHTDIDGITQDVMDLVAREFPDHFGDILPFHYAVNREQSLAALDQFIEHRLPTFGDYQDAMVQNEPWMFHSHISHYMNCGLLSPIECIRSAERAYHDGSAPLNAVEGFIRQILGWREYMRGIYWLKMPEYQLENHLNATRPLPDFYWTADTQMNCLRQCVSETKQNAYAHHIQRLMVLGNFALLAGIDPKNVNEWFLLVYADAYEWVELPNVTGMALFADGGVVASKPYAASGAYINKMSDYCKSCRYKVAKKNGPEACPFNYLYWDFLSRNQETIGRNPRMGLIYKSLARMSDEKRDAIASDSRQFLKALDSKQTII